MPGGPRQAPKEFMQNFRNLVNQSEAILEQLESQQEHTAGGGAGRPVQEGGGGGGTDEQEARDLQALIDESAQVLAEIEERERHGGGGGGHPLAVGPPRPMPGPPQGGGPWGPLQPCGAVPYPMVPMQQQQQPPHSGPSSAPGYYGPPGPPGAGSGVLGGMPGQGPPRGLSPPPPIPSGVGPPPSAGPGMLGAAALQKPSPPHLLLPQGIDSQPSQGAVHEPYVGGPGGPHHESLGSRGGGGADAMSEAWGDMQEFGHPAPMTGPAAEYAPQVDRFDPDTLYI